MALPAGVPGVTVTTGPWTLPDGSIATGRATITSPVNLVHTPTGQPLPSGSMPQRLVNGSASWVLVPTDQAGLNRQDATYTLSFEINGAATQPDPVTFLLPSAGPDTVDLDLLASVPSSAGTPVAPITVTSVNGQVGAVALTAADVGAAPAGSAGGVSSVNTKTGDVVLSASDVGAEAAGAATAAQSLAVQRANHTGTQPASTVTGLAAVATSGVYADLTAKPTVPTVGAAGAGAAVALSSTDATVTNSRTPTAHAASHASGSSDPITPAAIGAEVTGAASTAQAFSIQRANHTGTQSADTLTDGSTAKAFLATERTKLASVTTGATANSPDATLLARANHTGTQAASTVTGLAAVATSGSYADLTNQPAAVTDYMSALATGEETIPRWGINSGSIAISSQRLALNYFTARKSETITQVSITTGGTAAAATPTLCRFGIYSIDGAGNGTLVASTANDTTLFAATFTTYTRTLTTSWSKVAGQRYAVGILVVTGVATPVFPGNAQIVQGSGPNSVGASPRVSAGFTGQADLPASFTSASLSNVQSPISAVVLP